MPIQQFTYLQTGANDENFMSEFTRMQDIYVFNNKDMITRGELQKSIKVLKGLLNALH